MAYRIRIERRALKELRALPHNVQTRILQTIEALSVRPRPQGVKKLRTKTDSVFRIRVGDYRVLYIIKDKELLVMVIRIGDRKQVYR